MAKGMALPFVHLHPICHSLSSVILAHHLVIKDKEG
jgi:hypothetical protein